MKEVCAEHKKGGMANVRNKRCGLPGCNKNPSYGVQGSKAAASCAGHAKEGMLNPRSGRIFVGKSSSSGADDTQRAGGSPVGRTGEGRKRKDRSPLLVQAEVSSVRKHAKGEAALRP